MTEPTFASPASPAVPGVPQQVHHYYHPQKSGGTAALLELLPGMFLQTFGIGHIYAGNVGVGLLFMFGYWIVAFVNLLLCFIFIGFLTWPLCWIATAILSTVIASNSVKSSIPHHSPQGTANP